MMAANVGKFSQEHIMTTMIQTSIPSKRLANAVVTWLGVVIGLVIIKLLLSFFPDAFADPNQAAVFAWPMLAILSAVGLGGVFLAERTSFPDPLDALVPIWQRFLLPLGVGSVLGSGYVALDLSTGFSQLIAANHGLQQQYTGFWPMLLIFSAAAVIQTVIFRLMPLPLLLWLISSVLLGGRRQEQIFWLLAIPLAALEPLAQARDLLVLPPLVAVAIATFYYAVCLVEVGFLRKYGFLAAILARLGFYFVWHVLYVH
jgi:hypothetical protein